jgi:hypothetical protein
MPAFYSSTAAHYLETSSLDLLGHLVSAASVQPLSLHVVVEQEFPQPVTVKELQVYLGMVNFYRWFLPAIVRMLQPLTNSLHGRSHANETIPWSPECAEAFKASKQALLQATCLAHPTAGA